MTDPRDPIDEWLGADVELLRPPQGAFERIHRTARRRKAIRAVSTVAGAAVVIAAAVTLPGVAAGLLPAPAKVDAGRSVSPSVHRTSHRTGSPSPSSSAGSTASPSSANNSALGSTGRTHPAVPGFRPTSVTFVGRSTGAVIGQANCPSGSCTSVAGTHNYGHTWFQVGAPAAGPPRGSAGVSQIRFLDTVNGWAYGPALYATHDGGLTWKKITGLPGRVIDLSAVGNRAFAVIALGCTGAAQDYAANCTSIGLISISDSSDHWRLVPSGSGIPEAPGGLQLTSQYGYLMTKGLLFAGPVTGGAWSVVSNASPTVPPCLIDSGRRGPWLLAPWLRPPAKTALFLACNSSVLNAVPPANGPLALYESLDGGLTWTERGVIAARGAATSMAVAPASGWLVLATSKGIYYSTDQKSWHRASLTPGAAEGFSYIGMTTTLQGVAVPADPSLGEIFTTGDGGRTWRRQVIG